MPVFNPIEMTRRLACTRGRPRCSALASASIVVMQRVRMGAARVEVLLLEAGDKACVLGVQQRPLRCVSGRVLRRRMRLLVSDA